MDMRLRLMYNRLKRSYKHFPPELRKLIVIYLIVMHVLLFIAIVK